jgi:hypothetical protein
LLACQAQNEQVRVGGSQPAYGDDGEHGEPGDVIDLNSGIFNFKGTVQQVLCILAEYTFAKIDTKYGENNPGPVVLSTDVFFTN